MFQMKKNFNDGKSKVSDFLIQAPRVVLYIQLCLNFLIQKFEGDGIDRRVKKNSRVKKKSMIVSYETYI